MMLAWCLATAGRHDEAVAAGRLAVERDPESFVSYWALGSCLTLAEQYEEAVATLTRAALISNRNPTALDAMAYAYSRWDKQEAAEALRLELNERAEREYVASARLMSVAEAAGDREAAIQHALRAWNDREALFIVCARHTPLWQSLRADPRFQAILAEMNA